MFNVILPTYNEADSIKCMINVLDSVFSELKKPYLIILIDDNSPDNTSNIIKNLNKPNILIIDRKSKLGLGSAYIEGVKYCKYEYTIILDSDLQHDPYSIIDMYKFASKGYDIVSSTRYTNNGKVANFSFFRKLLSTTANNIARFILGLNTFDLTGSFRLYKTDVLKELIKNVKCKRFGFQMEIIARAEYYNYKIYECPIIFYQRKAGKSKISPYEVLYFLLAVLRLYFVL